METTNITSPIIKTLINSSSAFNGTFINFSSIYTDEPIFQGSFDLGFAVIFTVVLIMFICCNICYVCSPTRAKKTADTSSNDSAEKCHVVNFVEEELNFTTNTDNLNTFPSSWTTLVNDSEKTSSCTSQKTFQMDQNEMFNQNNFMYTITPCQFGGIQSAVQSWDMKSAGQSLENYL